MSNGGTMNHLYINTDADMLIQRERDLEQMADFLAGLGYAEDAAAATQRLLQQVRQARIRLETQAAALSELWRVAEWYHSGDRSEDDFKAKLEEWRSEYGVQPAKNPEDEPAGDPPEHERRGTVAIGKNDLLALFPALEGCRAVEVQYVMERGCFLILCVGNSPQLKQVEPMCRIPVVGRLRVNNRGQERIVEWDEEPTQ